MAFRNYGRQIRVRPGRYMVDFASKSSKAAVPSNTSEHLRGSSKDAAQTVHGVFCGWENQYLDSDVAASGRLLWPKALL